MGLAASAAMFSVRSSIERFKRVEDIVLTVVGGPGKHSMYLPTNGKSWSVTRPIVKADGSPWVPADF